MSKPLKVLLVLRDTGEKIGQLRREFEEAIRAFPGVSIIDAVLTDDIDPDADFELVIAMGGDGTILRTCRQLGRKQRPVVGVNMGHLGFLADLGRDEFLRRIPALAGRDYEVVPTMMFTCHLHRSFGEPETHLGLNEVGIHAAGAMQLLRVTLWINNQLVTTFAGDGLLVSTPVGSTAHALGAGGPILRQELEAFVIVPLCPHALSGRPLVDSAECVYRLQATNAQDGVMLSIDGQIKRPLGPDDVIEVRRADVDFLIARFEEHNFYTSLRNKLNWAGEPVYRQF
jgi:NAD+ kinase